MYTVRTMIVTRAANGALLLRPKVLPPRYSYCAREYLALSFPPTYALRALYRVRLKAIGCAQSGVWIGAQIQ